jgi:uncharacterized protein (DUF697 family)
MAFADAALLLPTQVGMLASVPATHGLSLSRAFLMTLVAGTLGGTAAALTGRTPVGGLLKPFPGVGPVVGGTINASAAATSTTALGMAYITTLDALFRKHDGGPPEQDEVLDEVRKHFVADPPPRVHKEPPN